jgi:hypothetical protein
MARKSKEQPLTIGFFGTGEVAEKEVGALLEDYLQDKGEDVTFVLPATKAHFTPTLQAVVDFALDCDPAIPYEVVTDEEGAGASRGSIAKVIKGAAKVHKVARIGQKVVSAVSAAPTGVLIVAWDDDDEDLEAVANRAVDNELPVRDLTLALEEVVFQPDGEEGGEDEPTKESDDDEVKGESGEEVEDAPYTREELEGAELEGESGLKAIAGDFGLEFPPRTRKTTYVDAILKAQEAAGGDEPEEKAEKDDEGSQEIEAEVGSLDTEALVAAIVEGLRESNDFQNLDFATKRLGDKVGNMVDRLAAVEEWMADLGKRLDNLGSAPAPEPEVESENAPADEPAPATPVRRRRRL